MKVVNARNKQLKNYISEKVVIDVRCETQNKKLEGQLHFRPISSTNVMVFVIINVRENSMMSFDLVEKQVRTQFGLSQQQLT